MKTSFKSIWKLCFIFSVASCNSKIDFPDGGYNYPVDVSKIDTNVFSYPETLKANRKDSFRSSYYGYYWHKNFDEPNLSIRPQSLVTFRLIYENGFGATSIFTLTPNQIVVKHRLQGHPYPENDTLKLDKLEGVHFGLLKRNFPIQDLPSDYRWKKSVDSFAIIYPKLLDPHYYKYLLDKSFTVDTIPFKYSVKKVMISNAQYNELVNQINASGYWSLPFFMDCSYGYADGYVFSLEANLPQKYNIVSLASCPEQTSKFSWACQAIVDACQLDKKIELISKPSSDIINIYKEVDIPPVKNNSPNKKKK